MLLASLKISSAEETINLLRKLDIDQQKLSEVLHIIIHRLVPMLCESCKEDYLPTKEEFDALAHFYGDQNFQELGVE